MSKILKTVHLYFHRAIALAVVLAGLLAQVATFAGAFPLSAHLAKALVPVAAFLAQAIVVGKFLDGQKAWDATPAGQGAAQATEAPKGTTGASPPPTPEPGLLGATERPPAIVAKAIPVRRHRKPTGPPTPPAA